MAEKYSAAQWKTSEPASKTAKENPVVKKSAKPTKKAVKKVTKAASKKKAAVRRPARVSAKASASKAAVLSQDMLDRLQIRELVENWALYRDAGMWDRFRTVWHKDGYMMATWFQGTSEEFIHMTQEGFKRGVSILHFLGGSTIDLHANRAVAQTKMTISQRAPVDGVLCDVLCTGRFYDFLIKEAGTWKLVLRRLIYEKDRLDVIDPGALLHLDKDLLESFPPGYRHLAYLQTKIGYKVKKNMPGLTGPDVDALYAFGKKWLETGSLEGAKEY